MLKPVLWAATCVVSRVAVWCDRLLKPRQTLFSDFGEEDFPPNSNVFVKRPTPPYPKTGGAEAKPEVEGSPFSTIP